MTTNTAGAALELSAESLNYLESVWAKSPELRKEFFDSKEAYFSYMRAAKAKMGTVPATSAAHVAGDPTDQNLRAQWDSNPKLRAEFIDFPNFSAYARALAAGRVRILGHGKLT